MTSQSPLTEPSPTSLDELFSREPETLTDEELDIIVAALRKHYQQFQLDDKTARSSGAKRVTTAKTKEQLQLDIKSLLDDIKL